MGERKRKMTLAVEAGYMAFEFLGERMNHADGAAGEARSNLDQCEVWIERIKAVIPEDRQRELSELVYPMLEFSADDE